MSLHNAIKPMNLACDQLYKQGYHLFQMYLHQESIILIAITSFWWLYFCYSHALSEKFRFSSEGDESEETEELHFTYNTRLPAQAGIHSILEEDLLNSDEMLIQVLQEQLYGFSLTSFLDKARHWLARFHIVLPQGRVKL